VVYALVASFLGAQNVIHVEDIIAILVIVAIVFGALARLCEDSAGVPRRLVLEARVADAICGRQMHRQSLERLYIKEDETMSWSEREERRGN
jgi:hypothetical protein